ncbi:MAG: hypothetical protein GWM87_03985, partial [Xanthomonadales bacterium]|nr:hypothetical protein [Xanthomonadales bacterium]NIX12186.1 hypothetical protein [Xanthomonadales bacterium]
AMLALTMAVGMRMGYARYTAVRRGEVNPKYYELYKGEEPEGLRKISRHYVNLLEVPPLFYVVCIIAYVTGQSSTLLLALAWLYVLLRVAHSLIHLGPNIVINRFRVFVLSAVVLTVLMVVVFLGVI